MFLSSSWYVHAIQLWFINCFKKSHSMISSMWPTFIPSSFFQYENSPIEGKYEILTCLQDFPFLHIRRLQMFPFGLSILFGWGECCGLWVICLPSSLDIGFRKQVNLLFLPQTHACMHTHYKGSGHSLITDYTTNNIPSKVSNLAAFTFPYEK